MKREAKLTHTAVMVLRRVRFMGQVCYVKAGVQRRNIFLSLWVKIRPNMYKVIFCHLNYLFAIDTSKIPDHGSL